MSKYLGIRLISNIPAKPTTKPLPFKSSDILTAEELNEEYSLEKVIEQKAKEVYKEYILPKAKEGYNQVEIPFAKNKTFLLYPDEPITNSEYREIFLFTKLGKYFNDLGYEAKINKSEPLTINNGAIRYSGLIIKW